MFTTTRKAWIEALKSGEFTQGSGCMQDDEGRNCCLGVAGTVAGFDWNAYDDESGQVLSDQLRTVALGGFNGMEYLPQALGINGKEEFLAVLNDGESLQNDMDSYWALAWDFMPKSFEAIADLLIFDTWITGRDPNA